VEPIGNVGSVSICPAEKLVANQSRFDLTRGYIPVLLATSMFAGGIVISFRAGSWIETFKQERSAVLERLDKIEAKLDGVIGKISLHQRIEK
jgi:hypothetical protein